jgi:hypothetical protein
LAPTLKANVSVATAVKPGFFSSWRRANLRSFMGVARGVGRGAEERRGRGDEG